MLSWWVLFGGALLDAVIGANFFVHGEPFFVGAGYLLSTGVYYGIPAVLIGGFLGDQISYMIGRKYGMQGRRYVTAKFPKSRRAFARAKLELNKRGVLVIAMARLLGAVAWVMPFLVGSYRVSWAKFTLWSSIGLVVGIGQFIALGYVGSKGISFLPPWSDIQLVLQENAILLFGVVVAVIFSVVCYRRFRRHKAKFGAIVASWLLVMLGVNYIHFFNSSAYQFDEPLEPHTQAVSSLEQLDYHVYSGLSAVYDDSQPMNIVLIGASPQQLMKELGWIQNKTFSRDEISFSVYLDLLRRQEPPISDLYWNKQPQRLAYQEKGDLVKRNHMRWWFAGVDAVTQQDIWLGAVSYDNRLELSFYKGILTVLHGIDPYVDVERDRLAERAQAQGWQVSTYKVSEPINFTQDHEFYTDGHVVVIKNSA